MNQSVIEETARSLAARIPSHLNAAEVVRACLPLARSIAAKVSEELNHWHIRRALAPFLSDLPADRDRAAEMVRRLAAQEQGVDTTDHDAKLAEARRAAAAAIAAEQEAGRATLMEMNRRSSLEKSRGNLEQAIARWDIDHEAGIAAAEAEIVRVMNMDPNARSPHDQSSLSASFENLHRLPILKRLAPAALATLRANLADVHEALGVPKRTITRPAKPKAAKPTEDAAREMAADHH